MSPDANKNVRQMVGTSSLSFLLSLPPRFASDGNSLPILCFLHGYEEAHPRELGEALTLHGPLQPGSWQNAVEQFIIIAPQLPVAGDVWHQYADAVREIVTRVRLDHGGDALRTYLTGFSFGANGVFELAGSQPSFWAALWAVDPTRVPMKDPNRPVWVSFGEVSRKLKSEFIASLGLRPFQPRTGEDRLYLDQGQDHVGSAKMAYQDERIYTWLLSKRLRLRRAA